MADDSATDLVRQAIQDILRDDATRRRASQFSNSLRSHPGLNEALNAIDETIIGIPQA